MIRANGRDAKGRFALGNPGRPGRPPIGKEREYLETLSTVVTLDDWKEICQRAVKDAKNGNYRAREWLSKYLLTVSVADVADEEESTPKMEIDYSEVDSELVMDALIALEKLERAKNGAAATVDLAQ